jgi:hypothetical protein
MHIRDIFDYNPREGFALQGDVRIRPIPAGFTLDFSEEIQPVDGRLILQEGEVTGHHHAIALVDRPTEPPHSRAVNQLMAEALAGNIAVPTARTYRDPKLSDALVKAGYLQRVDLVVCVLVIEVGPVCLLHEEHDGIRIAAGDGRPVQPDLAVWTGGYAFQSGRYLVGRQIESAGAELRMVAD